MWLYHRFCLSFREIEALLAERGITVTYETIRQWCQKFGPDYARKLKKRQGRLGDIWHIDEVFLTLHGLTQNLFRLGRHLMKAVHYRLLRTQALQVWEDVVCA